MRLKKKYTFTTSLELVDFNLVNSAVFLPHDINIELPKGRLKANGSMNGAPFSLSIQYRKDFGRFFSVSSALRMEANIQPGDNVTVTFRLMEIEKVEIPEELEMVLGEDDKARKEWSKVPAKVRRVLGQYVDSAKKIDSRIRRALEMVQKAKAGLLLPQSTRKTQSARKKRNQ
jgi:hypothetical protein